jgi:hypothetical protein
MNVLLYTIKSSGYIYILLIRCVINFHPIRFPNFVDAARRRQNQQTDVNTECDTSTPHHRSSRASSSSSSSQSHLPSQHTSNNPSAVTPSPYNSSTDHNAMNKSFGHAKALDNPYRSKNNSLNTTSSHELMKNPYKNHANESFTIGRTESFIKQQYPHREGRIRVDRQFSTAISIGETSEFVLEKNGDATSVTEGLESSSSSSENDDDELLTFTPFVNHSNR